MNSGSPNLFLFHRYKTLFISALNQRIKENMYKQRITLSLYFTTITVDWLIELMEKILFSMTRLKHYWGSTIQLLQYRTREWGGPKSNEIFEETFKEYACLEQVGSISAGSSTPFSCWGSFQLWTADHEAWPSGVTDGALTQLFLLWCNGKLLHGETRSLHESFDMNTPTSKSPWPWIY